MDSGCLVRLFFALWPPPKTAHALAQWTHEVAHGTGLSRGTARRYLEFLEAQGRTTLELRYGAAGRPGHRYRLVDPAGAR